MEYDLHLCVMVEEALYTRVMFSTDEEGNNTNDNEQDNYPNS